MMCSFHVGVIKEEKSLALWGSKGSQMYIL